jgi:DNA phosphorothioation-dependent restriction protein DptG
MESMSLSLLLDVFKNFGPIGLIAFMWWMDTKSIRKIMDENKQYVQEILGSYKRDMAEIRRMYEDNVRLVESHDALNRNYAALASDLKDAYIMTAQINQKLVDSIETNQYCPMVRLEKMAQGVQR